MNCEGEVKVFWKDLKLIQVSGTSFTGQWDPHLLVPYIEYKLMKLSNTRNIKLPLHSCLKLVESLASDQKPEGCKVDGYTISLNKIKAPGAGKIHPSNGDGLLIDHHQYKVVELNLANLTEKVELQIL